MNQWEICIDDFRISLSNYLQPSRFKVYNENTRTMCEVSSELQLKTAINN